MGKLHFQTSLDSFHLIALNLSVSVACHGLGEPNSTTLIVLLSDLIKIVSKLPSTCCLHVRPFPIQSDSWWKIVMHCEFWRKKDHTSVGSVMKSRISLWTLKHLGKLLTVALLGRLTKRACLALWLSFRIFQPIIRTFFFRVAMSLYLLIFDNFKIDLFPHWHRQKHNTEFKFSALASHDNNLYIE